MKYLFRYIVASVLIVCGMVAANTVEAQTNSSSNAALVSSPVITGAPSLSINPDAVGSAMGGLGVSTRPDAGSAFYNPAKLGMADQKYGVTLSYTPWMSGITKGMGVSHLAGYMKLGKDTLQRHTIGLSARYMHIGDVYIFGHAAGVAAIAEPYETTVDLSYSYLLTPEWALGASVRYVRSDLSPSFSEYLKPANGIAFDVGVFFNKELALSTPTRVMAGFAITNMGPKLNYGGDGKTLFLPTLMRLGGGAKVQLSEQFGLAGHLEIEKLLVPSFPGNALVDGTTENNDQLLDNYHKTSGMAGIFKSFGDAPGGFAEEMKEIVPSLGFELDYNQMVFARLGYRYQSPEKGSDSGITAGIGMKYSNFTFDFSYFATTQARNPLSGTIRFGVAAYF